MGYEAIKMDANLFAQCRNGVKRDSVFLRCRLFVLFQPGILCCDEIIFSSLQGFWLQHRIADTSLLEDAHEHGLSLGKNNVFLELSRYDANVTPANCREMTMTQIRNRMKECRDGEHESDSQGGNRSGYGSNHHGQGKNGQGQSGGKWGGGNRNDHGNPA